MLADSQEELTAATAARANTRLGLRWELVALAGISLLFLAHAVYLNVPAEDAFITFRFARHLAQGHGIVWNTGEAPVEGYTNFSWLLLSALALRLGLDVVFLTQALGVAASLAAIFVVYRFATRLFHLPVTAALFACLLLAGSGPFATWAASSMETNFFTLLLLLACYAFVRWAQHKAWRDLAVANLFLFFATLTRPEGFMVFSLLAAVALALLPARRGKADLPRYLLSSLVYLLPFLVYFIWRYSYFGYLLPNTFYAKTGGGLEQVIRGLKYSLFFGLLFIFPLAPVVAAWIWESDWDWRLRRPVFLRSLYDHLNRHIAAYTCASVVIVYTAYIVVVGGDYMAMFRFFVPVVPQICLLAGLFTHLLFERIRGQPHKRNLAALILAGAAGLTMLQSLPLEEQIFPKPWFMHGTYRGVQHERWHVARNTLAGEFFRTYPFAPGDSLAVLGIGIIPFLNEDLTVYSFHGIVDPVIAHQPPNQVVATGFAGHEKIDFVSVISRKPAVIMVDTGDLYPEPQPFPDYPDEIDAFVRENYALKVVWLEDRVNHEAGYLHYLVLK